MKHKTKDKMRTTAYLLPLFLLILLAGCDKEDIFLPDKNSPHEHPIAFIAQPVNQVVAEEMEITMFVSRNDTIVFEEVFTSMEELNAAEIVFNPGQRYRLFIAASESVDYAPYFRIRTGDVINMDSTLLFSATPINIKAPIYYGFSEEFDAADGLQESIELKPIVYKMSFHVNSMYSKFIASVPIGQSLSIGGKNISKATIYNFQITKPENLSTPTYSGEFYAIAAGQENATTTIDYQLCKKKLNFQGKEYEIWSDFSYSLDSLGNGKAYSLFVDEHIYNRNTQAIFRIKFYEPLKDKHFSDQAEVVFSRNGMTRTETISVAKSESNPYLYIYCNAKDFEQGIWTLEQLTLNDTLDTPIKQFRLDYEFAFYGTGFPSYTGQPDSDESLHVEKIISWTFSRPEDGDGTMESPYIVDTPEKFEALRHVIMGRPELAYVRQTCDLDFTEACSEGGFCYNNGHGFHSIIDGSYSILSQTYTPYYFNAVYDGGGHRIKGIIADGSLFGYLKQGAEIKNLIIDASCYFADSSALVYVSEGTISNCENHGRVEGQAGIVCHNHEGTIINCANYGEIGTDKTEGVAGIAYQNNGVIIGCVNYGTITGKDHAGGIYSGTVPKSAGYSDPGQGGIIGSGGPDYSPRRVENCRNEGKITAKEYLGGIGVYASFLTDCVNTGDIYSTATISHLDSTSYAGGLLSICNEKGFTITDCRNEGSVTGSKFVGGLLGGIEKSSHQPIFTGCENTGAISGHAYVGGIAGTLGKEPEGCSNTGSVTGLYYYGDIYGFLLTE